MQDHPPRPSPLQIAGLVVAVVGPQLGNSRPWSLGISLEIAISGAVGLAMIWGGRAGRGYGTQLTAALVVNLGIFACSLTMLRRVYTAEPFGVPLGIGITGFGIWLFRCGKTFTREQLVGILLIPLGAEGLWYHIYYATRGERMLESIGRGLVAVGLVAIGWRLYRKGSLPSAGQIDKLSARQLTGAGLAAIGLSAGWYFTSHHPFGQGMGETTVPTVLSLSLLVTGWRLYRHQPLPFASTWQRISPAQRVGLALAVLGTTTVWFCMFYGGSPEQGLFRSIAPSLVAASVAVAGVKLYRQPSA